MPKDRFTCIAEIEHRSIICANENQSVIERVFLPNHQIKDYKIPSLFDMMWKKDNVNNMSKSKISKITLIEEDL